MSFCVAGRRARTSSHGRKNPVAQARSSATAFGSQTKDRPAARCVSRGDRRPGDAADLDRVDVGVFHVHLVIGDHTGSLQRLRKPLGFKELPHERHANHVWSRLDFGANLEAGITGELHVGFPFGIAGKTGLAVACVARSRRPALRAATDGEPLQQPAVETHVELLRPPHAF